MTSLRQTKEVLKELIDVQIILRDKGAVDRSAEWSDKTIAGLKHALGILERLEVRTIAKILSGKYVHFAGYLGKAQALINALTAPEGE